MSSSETSRHYSILYWAISSPEHSPGIQSKVSDFIETAEELGYKAVSVLQKPGTYFSYFVSHIKVLTCDNDITIYRYNNMMGALILLMCALSRLLGKTVVLDVPTPVIYHLRSILMKKNRGIRGYVEIANALLLGPFPFIAANLVIHYSKESKYFQPKNFTKSILIGNGIRTSKWPNPVRPNGVNAKRLRLIGVGAVAEWHAWERVIKAISICRTEAPDLLITFTIVGFGPELNSLQILSRELGLENNVINMGLRSRDELSKLYSEADLGVGSFGWDKLGVTVASPLKYREYLANGLPFIYSTEDPDISEASRVAFMIKPNEDAIARFLIGIKIADLPSPDVCRGYCVDKMDYLSKIPRIMQCL
jgi:glycosyltransferase involved in cell wall biosynthesis